jgi:hypothetical protein
VKQPSVSRAKERIKLETEEKEIRIECRRHCFKSQPICRLNALAHIFDATFIEKKNRSLGRFLTILPILFSLLLHKFINRTPQGIEEKKAGLDPSTIFIFQIKPIIYL